MFKGKIQSSCCDRLPMRVPETTSAENLHRYSRGTTLIAGEGHAWREIKASIVALPASADAPQVPSVSEPLLFGLHQEMQSFRNAKTAARGLRLG